MRTTLTAAGLSLLLGASSCGSLVGDYEVGVDASVGGAITSAGGAGGSDGGDGGNGGDGGALVGGGGGGQGGDPLGGGGGGPSFCGDQVIDAGEQCDDGNSELGDGCHNCLLDCLAPDFQHGDTGRCYRLEADMELNWDQAEAECMAWSGTLACISTPEEQNFLDSIMNLPVPLWLGGTDLNTPGDFRWVNGEPWGFTQWIQGRPGNNNDENCVQLDDVFAGLDYVWRTRKCDQQRPFLCERAGNPPGP